MKIKDVKINEALNQPYSWKWARRDDEFSIGRAILPDGRELNVSFHVDHNNQELYDISFDVDDDTAATGGGDQFRIFATVVDIVEKWWNLNKDRPYGERPRWINFSSEKLEMETGKEGSKGRTKLYTRFAKQFAQKANLALEIDDQSNQVVFKLKPRKKGPRKVEEVNIDNKNGWGAVPNNMEIDYFGMKVLMRPSTFISLAPPLSGEPSEKIKAHIANGGSIGAPFLIINVPDEMDKPASVSGHEGRNRMLAVQAVEGDKPIEVHLLFRGRISRARHLTPEIKNYFNKGLYQQGTSKLVRGPLWKVLQESIVEDGRIVKGVNTTADVKPGETKRQAAKFGNKVNSKNEPPLLNAKARKKSTPHVLSNLGLAESTQINELFDKKYKWKWLDLGQKQGIARFKTSDGGTIVVLFGKYKSGAWDVEFEKDGDYSKTNEGDQFAIMATVMDIIKDFVESVQPPELIFSAEKDPKPGARMDSRPNLYKRMVSKFAAAAGYQVDQKQEQHATTFHLKRIDNTNESTQITELFDKGYTWSWTQRPALGSWRAQFDTDTGNVDVIFMPASRGSQNYEVAFSKNGEVNRTNEGDQFRIFATVINIIESFMTTRPGAESLTFVAKREGAAAEDPKITDSRAELYKRMVSKFAKKHDLEFVWQKVGRMTEFMLRRNNVNEAIVKPRPEDTLGVKRTEMPQVHKDHYPELIKYLKNHGGKFSVGKVNAKNLKPVQSEFSDAGVEKMIGQMKSQSGSNFDKPLIVSSDNYIIDGHHRWLAAWNENMDVAIMKISIPIKQLLQLVRNFKHTTYKDIYTEMEQAILEGGHSLNDLTEITHKQSKGVRHGRQAFKHRKANRN